MALLIKCVYFREQAHLSLAFSFPASYSKTTGWQLGKPELYTNRGTTVF